MKLQKFKQTEIGKITEDWKESILENKITHRKGFAFKSSEFQKEGHPIIRVSNFTDKSINLKNCDHLDTNKVINYKEVQLKFCDIVIATVGSWPNNPSSIVGRVIKVPKEADKALLNQNAVIIRPNKNLDNDFLFYRLKNRDFSNYLISGAQGSANQASITLRSIFSFSFSLPPLPEQLAIAKILSSLDAKIELNNKMNKTLEAIGQAIFKKWFVDEKEDKWKDGFFNDKILTELIKPGIDKFEGEKIYLPTANISNSSITNYDYKITFEKRPSRASMQPKANTIWFAKMKDSPKIQLFLEDENWRLNNLILSTGFAGIKPKKEALFYIWNIINNPYFEIEKDNLSMGTTMQAINNENITKIKYAIPDKEILLKFNQLTKPLYYITSINNQQNQTLSQIRDSLLPKLMSGKVRVK